MEPQHAQEEAQRPAEVHATAAAPTDAAKPAPEPVVRETAKSDVISPLAPPAAKPEAPVYDEKTKESPNLLLPDQPSAPNPEDALEPDDDDANELDSAYGDDVESYATSIASSAFAYTYENGRRYHAYRAGQYVMPNDEREQERLDLLHHVHLLCLDGELFRAPIKEDAHRVLDIGTGTGIWAIEFADRFPSADVIGTDLSPIQPSWVPPNVRFEIDDAEDVWPYPLDAPFDFIHLRTLAGSVYDWEKLFGQAMKHLKPGAWIEAQEFECWMLTDNDTFPENSFILEWLDNLDKASTQAGAKMNIAEMHGTRMKAAGFVNVTDDVYKIPLNPWPKDKKMKEIGRYQLVAILAAVEPYCLALFTRVLGWSNEKVQALLVGVRQELRNPAVHVYANLHFVYGQKPITAET